MKKKTDKFAKFDAENSLINDRGLGIIALNILSSIYSYFLLSF